MRHPSGKKGDLELYPQLAQSVMTFLPLRPMEDMFYIGCHLLCACISESGNCHEINAKTTFTKEGKRSTSTLVLIWISVLCSSGNRCYGESLILFSNEYSTYLLFIRFSPELPFLFFIPQSHYPQLSAYFSVGYSHINLCIDSYCIFYWGWSHYIYSDHILLWLLLLHQLR